MSLSYPSAEGLTPAELHFRRKFCVNPCRTLRLPLSAMSLSLDFLAAGERGDPYPLTESLGEGEERVEGGCYTLRGAGARRCRLLGRHFPYASYELELLSLGEGGSAGFVLACTGGGSSLYAPGNAPRLEFCLQSMGDGLVALHYSTGTESGRLGKPLAHVPGMCLCVAFSGARVTSSVRIGGQTVVLGALELSCLASICHRGTFVQSHVSLCLCAGQGPVCVTAVQSVLDAGLCQADPRPARYEDGTPILREGRLYTTLSTRSGGGGYQAVVSWQPDFCDFRLEGALFFDLGDGFWSGDIASSLIYDRRARCWRVWMCSFSHGHLLCSGQCGADLLHGIHVIDVRPMPTEHAGEVPATLSDDRLFLGKFGDEDPDFYYDESEELWHLVVCRPSALAEALGYRYFHFTSPLPDRDFVFAGAVEDVGVTGGSILFFGGERWLVYGRNFNARASYACVRLSHPEEVLPLHFDFDDGGFRGWGTLIPLPCGDRTKYLLLTFDRQLGNPADNWSYGNLYVFEADEMLPAQK